MLRFNLDFTRLDFDERYSKAYLDAWLKNEMKEAAREFFQAALPHIHIDTGMSIASMTNLATFLNEPLNYRPRSAPEPGGYRPPNTGIQIDKSPENGIQLGAPIGSILQRKANGSYTFTYSTEVWHFVLWDTVGLPEGRGRPIGQPWKAFEYGREAALRYLREESAQRFEVNQMIARTLVDIKIQDGSIRTRYRNLRHG